MQKSENIAPSIDGTLDGPASVDETLVGRAVTRTPSDGPSSRRCPWPLRSPCFGSGALR
jgi:hypothetical protein